MTTLTCLRDLGRGLLYSALSLALGSAQVNVLTGHYDVGRTGANLSETQLTVANVTPATFGVLGSLPVDGQIFAQPLYVSGVSLPGQEPRNVVYITSEHNNVYAYDADEISNPNLLWRVNLGPPVPSTMFPSDTASGPFIDVNPEVGILSTPVIDPQSGVLYVVANTLVNSQLAFQLHALDLATGQERMNGPVTITASSGSIPFDPAVHIQRPSLLLTNGAVYVAFGSHADFGEFHGWLISYDAANVSNQLGVFQTTPAGRGGAVWQSGRGVAADEYGSIYVATGNGDYDGVRNFSQSLLKISTLDLSISDWFTPADWQYLSDNDSDLSAGPAVLPGTHAIIGGDKKGRIYLVNSDSMGHLGTEDSSRVTPAVGGFIFNFALWARPDATYIYLRENDGSVKSFAVTPDGFDPNPISVSAPTTGTARVGMALSANGSQDGTGILWMTTGDYLRPFVPVMLHAFDASNLANEIWNSEMSAGDSLNGFAKFTSPTVANGKVYTPSSNGVVVYGLRPASGGDDPAPLPAHRGVSRGF